MSKPPQSTRVSPDRIPDEISEEQMAAIVQRMVKAAMAVPITKHRRSSKGGSRG